MREGPPARPAPAPRSADVRLSLLALGDWGRHPEDGNAPPAQMQVGEALAREDLRAPVDALVFLGDNFYPHGLEKGEGEPRLRLNVAAPYCHFAKLTEKGERALGGDCAEREADRHPVPLWVGLGNHDHHLPIGAAARGRGHARVRRELAAASARPVETLELPQGVSLIFYDSSLTAAVAERGAAGADPRAGESEGAVADPGRAPSVRRHARRRRGVESAIAASGVRAQLHLAGHIHDLRAGELAAPLPALQIVSGAGGGHESSGKTLPGETFQRSALGFARVDLVAAGGAERAARSGVRGGSRRGGRPGRRGLVDRARRRRDSRDAVTPARLDSPP